MTQLKGIYSDRARTPRMILDGSLQGSCDSDYFQEEKMTHETGDAENFQMRPRCGLFRSKTTTNGDVCFVLHVLLQPIRRFPELPGKMNSWMICPFQCVFP